MVKENNVWKFYGNGEEFWSTANYNYGSSWKSIWFGFKDTGKKFTDISQVIITVNGPYATNLRLTYDSENKYSWEEFYREIRLPLSIEPSVDWVYRFTATDGVKTYEAQVRIANILDAIPHPTIPADNASGIPNIPTFEWEDNVLDRYAYEVQVSTSASSKDFIWNRQGIFGTSVVFNDNGKATIPQLGNGYYYWRVRARDSNRQVSMSDWTKFLVGPTGPVTIDSYNVATRNTLWSDGWGTRMTFWFTVTDSNGTVPDSIASIRIEAPDGTIFNPSPEPSPEGIWIPADKTFWFTPSASAFQNNQIPDGWYYITVTDFEGYSHTVSEYVKVNPIQLAKNLQPSHRTIVESLTPTLSWDSVPRAAYYVVEISDGTTIIHRAYLSATQYTIPSSGNLSPSMTYNWRVRADDDISDNNNQSLTGYIQFLTPLNTATTPSSLWFE